MLWGLCIWKVCSLFILIVNDCRPPSPPAPPGMAADPLSGDCLITFADLPAALTLPDENGGVITNSLGLFPRECGLSFHSE